MVRTPERLYFQYIPDEAGLQRLLTIQSEAQAAYDGDTIDPQQLHMTLLHFGLVNDIYRAIHTAAVKLKKDFFLSNVQTMIHRVDTAMPDEADVTLVGYKRFGPGNTTLVALASIGTELGTAQQVAVEAVQDCLLFSGIKDAQGFMAKDDNFSRALDYEPHISLLTQAGYAPTVPGLQETLHLVKVPPSYDLRHGRYA